jgi:hypothetical protein
VMITIEKTTPIHAPIERCFDLTRGVEVHLLGNIHFQEPAVAPGGRTSGLIELEESVTWRNAVIRQAAESDEWRRYILRS